MCPGAHNRVRTWVGELNNGTKTAQAVLDECNAIKQGNGSCPERSRALQKKKVCRRLLPLHEWLLHIRQAVWTVFVPGWAVAEAEKRPGSLSGDAITNCLEAERSMESRSCGSNLMTWADACAS